MALAACSSTVHVVCRHWHMCALKQSYMLISGSQLLLPPAVTLESTSSHLRGLIIRSPLVLLFMQQCLEALWWRYKYSVTTNTRTCRCLEDHAKLNQSQLFERSGICRIEWCIAKSKLFNELERGALIYEMTYDTYVDTYIHRLWGTPFDKCGAHSGLPQLCTTCVLPSCTKFGINDVAIMFTQHQLHQWYM